MKCPDRPLEAAAGRIGTQIKYSKNDVTSHSAACRVTVVSRVSEGQGMDHLFLRRIAALLAAASARLPIKMDITFPGDARLLQLTRAMQRFVLAEYCRATPLAHTNEPTQPAHLGWLDKYTSEKTLVTRYGLSFYPHEHLNR
jgi:hypothetical protein